MKKQSLFILFASMYLLSGCQNSSSPAQTSASAAETTVESSAIETKSVDTSEKNVSDMPDTDGLVKELTVPVSEIGCSVGKMEFTDLHGDASSEFYVNVVMDSDNEPLVFDCTYINIINKWSVGKVTGLESGHCYWVSPGLEGSMDLYDYASGNLVSEKDPNFSSGDIQKAAESQADEVKDDFNAALESIGDKYKK